MASRIHVASFDPDEDHRPRRPAPTQDDAYMAAAYAGFCHFIRDPDPRRADVRWDRRPELAKQERIAEFQAMLTAFVAAGGRV